MTSDDSDRLFEVSAGAGGEPFEENGLRQRTDFQSRAPRAGADFKRMAIRRVTDAGATVERTDFEIDDIPVDAEGRGTNGRSFCEISTDICTSEQTKGAPNAGPILFSGHGGHTCPQPPAWSAGDTMGKSTNRSESEAERCPV